MKLHQKNSFKLNAVRFIDRTYKVIRTKIRQVMQVQVLQICYLYFIRLLLCELFSKLVQCL